ncbi:hypothetical protein [Methylobacterium oryzisoli]|uniref:hypothetical protein n=1 Tax=Methylobacterium oryzisoli TaxID=3385502 RepID=UPI003891E092
MRQIEVEEGLRLRFPRRTEEFNEGVEIGLLVARIARGDQAFTCLISAANVDQARVVAQHLGYRIQIAAENSGLSEVHLSSRPKRPKLTLVHDNRRIASS